MENIRSYNLGETALSIIAIILTIGDISYRGIVIVFKRAVSLLFQLFCILLLAVAVILAYLIVMAISSTAGPWLNTHLQ